jgi:sortase (surface protein transpeptidase)
VRGPLVLSAVALAILSIPGQPTSVPPVSRIERNAIGSSVVPRDLHLPPRAIRTEPSSSDRLPAPSPPSEDVASPYGQPVRLTISAIGVDTPLIRLGLNPDRSLMVPEDYQIAGWYIHSPVPGDAGPAVIVGHVDSYLGPGVFHSLAQLRTGDPIVVHGRNGSVARFLVERIEQFPKAEFPTEMVYGAVPYPALRLITCGGTFNQGTGHYEDNVIVFARLAH